MERFRTCFNNESNSCVGKLSETANCNLGVCIDFEDINERVVIKNTLVKTVSLLEKAYTVSFKLKSNTYIPGWASVIHLTTEGNTGVYGYRTPALWFFGGKLTVWSAISGYSDYFFKTATVLPLNEWLNIRISQFRINGVFTFMVYIDGRVAYNDYFQTSSVTNTDPRAFENVKIYAANPWYDTQDASIKDLQILNGNIEQIIEDRETILAQRNLVAVIPRLEKSYRIFFDVKPNSFSKGWQNVIHFTICSDASKYGDRVPGVWFHNSGDGSLYIVSHINGKLNSFFKTEPITLNEWSRIGISQQIENSVYVYRIKLNGDLVYAVENTQPKSFENVKVYASNPWHTAQDGSIKDLYIINGLSDDTISSVSLVLKDFVEVVTEEVLTKDNLIATLEFIEKAYSIFFKIKPTTYSPWWKNVIHLTTEGNAGEFGFRTPGVWFSGDTGKICVFSAINGNPNFETPPTLEALPLNEWSCVRVSQVRVNNIYLLRVYINGRLNINLENTAPQSFKNVKVYNADPWFDVQLGSIKDLRIFNGNVEQLVDDRETPLTQRNVVAIIPRLEMSYRIFFDVKPNSFSEGWHNVIHFINGSNASKYGDKVPGVWFYGSVDGSLYIASFINGILGFFNNKPITMKEWSHIEISQLLEGSTYVYRIKLNGDLVYVVENAEAKSFDNVQVYASNPWHAAQDGSIKDLYIINGLLDDNTPSVVLVLKDFVEVVTEEVLKRDNLIATLPFLKKTYSVSFMIKPTSFLPVNTNIIHLTTGDDTGDFGTRNPGDWFYNGTGRLLVVSAISGDFNNSFITLEALPLNKWSTIRVSQVQVNSIYLFQVYVDGKLSIDIENTDPRSFNNVKVYNADPWSDVQLGSIKDLRIFNKIEKIIEDRETQLAKRNLVAVIPRLEKSYRIFFDAKPNSFSKGWHNVIHLTTGSDASKYDRLPGVWFDSSGEGSLYIASSINSSIDSFFKTKPIILKQWSHIEISQLLEDSKYVYRIKLNGDLVCVAENAEPKSFDNVQVYASNPWHTAQDGSIKDLNIINGLSDDTMPSVVLVLKDFVEIVTERLLEKDNLIATLPILEKAYSVSFMIKPTSFLPVNTNIIHLTTEDDMGDFGTRNPGLWFYKDTGKLSVVSAVSGNPNYELITPRALPLGTWSSIRVSQYRVNSTYIFRVYVDGRLSVNIENTDPQSFENVKVYNADPWNDTQLASIKDLRIFNGNLEQLIEDRETPLVQNKLVAVVPRLDQTYKIYFDVKPNSFSEGWHNVIRFNVGSNASKYNDSVPGMWFHNSGDGSLFISAPLNGNLENSFKTAPLPVNVWSHIEINQQLDTHNSVYVYTIKLNGEKIFVEENMKPEIFEYVQVYASDPCYQAQDGFIKDLAIINGKADDVNLANVELVSKDFSFPTEEVLKKDNFIGMLPLLETTYSIFFKIKPTSYLAGWRSVIHLTDGEDDNKILSMWFYDDTGMHVWSGSNVYLKTPQIPLNIWSNIKISQEQVDGIYSFRVYINGTHTNNVSNIVTQSFKNVMVYATNPWYSQQPGSIKDLRIVNRNIVVSNTTTILNKNQSLSSSGCRNNYLIKHESTIVLMLSIVSILFIKLILN